MREIKFRAWDKKTKRMKLVNQLDFEHYGKIQVWLDDEDTSYIDEDVKLMQYTGMKDRNNKEVYEMDMVKSYSKLNGKVIFCYGAFRVNGWLLDELADTEVIGNIYENPELINFV